MATVVTKSFPATFVRGGTSNGLIISRSALPPDAKDWGPILSDAMGSPDPYGRQLNGMGSGISSTSKICVISPSKREDADVDYTFVQVGIKHGELDMAGNCGNMSSAVGPVAWDAGMVGWWRMVKEVMSSEVTVRLFNTNTEKIVHSTFSVGREVDVVNTALYRLAADVNPWYEALGDYSIDGVPGHGSKISLSFIDPAGAKTGKALPTGNPVDCLKLEDGSVVWASLVDVANPNIFVLASDIGVPGDITSDALGANSTTMSRLDEIRRVGAEKMGLDPDVQSVPKIVLISKPTAKDVGISIVCRALSMQQPHKAAPLTSCLALGAACRMPGTLPAITAVGTEETESVVIAHASGKLEVGCVVGDAGSIQSALLHRTARVLMKGDVFYVEENPDDEEDKDEDDVVIR